MPHDYRQVQFIGYEINTFPKTKVLGRDVTVGPVELSKYWIDQSYHANPDNRTDIDHRLTLMAEAIQEAVTIGSPRADCLKIFMAPEFYFRGRTGAYALEEVVDLIVPPLQMLVANLATFEHWMFVFGTMIGASQGTEKHPKTGAPMWEIYNVALVHNGGFADHTGSKVVMKEFRSGIDFVSKYQAGAHGELLEDTATYDEKLFVDHTKHLKSGTKTPTGWNPNLGHGAEVGSAHGGESMFQRDGIAMGLEVCLDHLMARLRRSPPAAGQPKLRIQLIPSAGMRIKEESVIAQVGGYAFNCDGGHVPDPAVVKKVAAEPKKGGSAKLSDVARAAKVAVQLHRKGLAATYLAECFPNGGHNGGPRLVAFGPLPLPGPVTVTQAEATTSHWVADASGRCHHCGQELPAGAFGWGKRHHCRKCGALICTTCSVMVTIQGQQVRICADCDNTRMKNLGVYLAQVVGTDACFLACHRPATIWSIPDEKMKQRDHTGASVVDWHAGAYLDPALKRWNKVDDHYLRAHAGKLVYTLLWDCQDRGGNSEHAWRLLLAYLEAFSEVVRTRLDAFTHERRADYFTPAPDAKPVENGPALVMKSLATGFAALGILPAGPAPKRTRALTVDDVAAYAAELVRDGVPHLDGNVATGFDEVGPVAFAHPADPRAFCRSWKLAAERGTTAPQLYGEHIRDRILDPVTGSYKPTTGPAPRAHVGEDPVFKSPLRDPTRGYVVVSEYGLRGDRRPPAVVRASGGFQPNATRDDKQQARGTKEVLDSYAHQSSTMGNDYSGYVSFSRNLGSAAKFVTTGGWVYVARCRDAVDVEATFVTPRYPEFEISAPGGVEWRDVVAWRKLGATDWESQIFVTTDEQVLPPARRADVCQLLSLTFAEVGQAK
jgi:hypothetical protein